MKSLTHTLIAIGLLVLAVPHAVQARTEIDEGRPISADGSIQIDNMAGSIEVIAWDQSEVEIRGQLGDRVDELEITETSGGLRIRVHNQDNQRRLDATHLRLQLPRGVSLELESISADITVKAMDNRNILASSVSGDINIVADTGRLDVESVSGDVRFVGKTPRVSLETVSGKIDVQGVEGEVRITTVSGDLILVGGATSLGRFETVSGDLELNLMVSDSGRLSAKSMSGDVTLVLPGDQQAEFSAQTYSGGMRTDFGVVAKEPGSRGRNLDFTTGNNGASIRIESLSGDVRLKKN